MDTLSGIHLPLQDTSFLHFTYTPLLPTPPNTILQNLCNPWYHSS